MTALPEPAVTMADAALASLEDCGYPWPFSRWGCDDGPDWGHLGGSEVEADVAMCWGQITGIACALEVRVLELVEETAWHASQPRPSNHASNLYGEGPYWSGENCVPGCPGHACSEGCPGWAVFESGRGLEIQACDECGRFIDSDGVSRNDWAAMRAGWRGFALLMAGETGYGG